MVFFLWVIIISCVLPIYLLKYAPTLSTFASSRAASTSSNKQNGIFLIFKTANSRLIAVRVFSPPDNKLIEVIFFPGGETSILTPVSKILDSSVNFNLAYPPPNNSLKTLLNSISISIIHKFITNLL